MFGDGPQNRFKWIVPIGGICGWRETGGTIYDCRLEFKAERNGKKDYYIALLHLP
jgi:hypothetical protein